VHPLLSDISNQVINGYSACSLLPNHHATHTVPFLELGTILIFYSSIMNGIGIQYRTRRVAETRASPLIGANASACPIWISLVKRKMTIGLTRALRVLHCLYEPVLKRKCIPELVKELTAQAKDVRLQKNTKRNCRISDGDMPDCSAERIVQCSANVQWF
jgi:hypothetical protein